MRDCSSYGAAMLTENALGSEWLKVKVCRTGCKLGFLNRDDSVQINRQKNEPSNDAYFEVLEECADNTADGIVCRFNI